MNPIRELRLLLWARKHITKLKEIASVKFSWPAFFMFLGVVSVALNELMNIMPAWHHYISAAAVLVTMLGGLRAFFVNPDGTPAKAAWTPEK